MSKNIVLTGMMGVGKTTIGKSIAKKLSLSFVDVDKIIEEKEGCSINIIFKNKSENYFRVLENKVTLEQLRKKNSVISLGGGAFLNKEIRNEVKNSCISFWLDVSANVLLKRLNRSKKRPLLNRKNLNEDLNRIYSERKKTYSEANYRIKCNTLKPTSITNRILKIYEDTRD